MPTKTIYLKEEDLPLWEKVQNDLGDSISSTFAKYLRERIEATNSNPSLEQVMNAKEELRTKLGLSPVDLQLQIEPPTGMALVRLALLALSHGHYESAQTFWRAHLKELEDLHITGFVRAAYESALRRLQSQKDQA